MSLPSDIVLKFLKFTEIKTGPYRTALCYQTRPSVFTLQTSYEPIDLEGEDFKRLLADFDKEVKNT